MVGHRQLIGVNRCKIYGTHLVNPALDNKSHSTPSGLVTQRASITENVWTVNLTTHVQTSLWEDMPLSVIEAQIADIPAVVTDVVGKRDVVRHGETDFIAKNECEKQYYCEKQRARQVVKKMTGQVSIILIKKLIKNE